MAELTSIKKVFQLGELCSEIGRHLPLIQILLLSKFTQWAFTANVRKEIKRRLIERGHSEEFLDMIVRTKSVLSGSFLLSVLVSPIGGPLEWKAEDIDIYNHKVEDKKKCPECNEGCDRSLFTDFLCKVGAWEDGEGMGYPALGILRSNKWKVNEDVIDNIMIVPEHSCLKRFVFDTFDLDFCKVVYGGSILSIFNPYAVLKKSCIYTGDKEALKYIESSYGYYNEAQSNKIFKELRMERLYKTYTIRREKYEKRGFEIINSFDMESVS